jgi:integrase
MPVDDFALRRGATEPVTSKQTAEKVWEPKFVAEIVAGGDPRVAPTTQQAAAGLTVAAFLDRYFETYVVAEGLRSARSISARLQAVKAVLGDEPVAALEQASEIARFKAAYRQGREIATVNRALSILRAAINWGRFQDPPILTMSPFHRFGVSIRTKDETKRDRRIGVQEEQRLLTGALDMNGPDHKFVGSAMHDRLVGALETCCRQGEMLRIQNRHVDWERHQIAIPGANAKDADNRRIPFDPHGRLAPILKRRRRLGRALTSLAPMPESSSPASRQPGNRSCYSQTATTQHVRSPEREWTARSSDRSICTGMTYVTKAPAACWRMVSISARFS